MNEELANELNKFFENLNYKYKINYGGCCYVAYLIARELEKRHIKYKLMCEYENYGKIYNLKHECSILKYNLKNRLSIDNNTTINFGMHIFIKVNKYLINKGDIVNDSKVVCIPNVNSVDIYNAYNNIEWNYRFNTFYKNTIKNRIVNKFKELYNEN